MALKRSGKNGYVAQLVNADYGPCSFCHRTVNDEIGYGKLYSIGEIYCHYFCVLLSCCLIQKGQDEEGLLGFLYTDILAEIERSKKHKCSHCGRGGATLGCAVSRCRRQFHLPCAREHAAISLFYGNYKSYCEKHAPRQQIEPTVMLNAKARMAAARKSSKVARAVDLEGAEDAVKPQEAETVCVICCESVKGYPTTQTFWPPCCARDAWFHRSCLERMALSAGQHYLKCPLCNDKQNFYNAVVSQGYYVPDRDAAWEMDEDAFRDMYEREVACAADECLCPDGRHFDEENSQWDIKLCLLCGGNGCHTACSKSPSQYVCEDCKPAAPADLDALEREINKVILQEAPRPVEIRTGPVMTSRMSIRRTKQRVQPTTSQAHRRTETTPQVDTSINTKVSRLELNLKSPKKSVPIFDSSVLQNLENKLISPIKLLEEKLYENCLQDVKLDRNKLVETLRVKFKRPRPLCAKKKIINALINELLKETPSIILRIPLKELTSPTKFADGKENVTLSSPKSNEKVIEEIITPEKESLKKYAPKSSEVTPVKNMAAFIADPESDQPPETVDLQSSRKPEEKVNEGPIIPSQEESLATPKKDTPKISEETPVKNIDDSSTSTFELAPEFIADHHSDESMILFETSKKSTTVEIKKDSSMEISEDNNEHINIDVIKIDAKNAEEFVTKEKVMFSPSNKEELDESRSNIDLECFKNQYLNEVDKKCTNQCSYNHKHEKECNGTNSMFSSTIQFAINAALTKNKTREERKIIKKEKKTLKRRLKAKERRKRRKKNRKESKDNCIVEYEKDDSSVKIKLVYKVQSPNKNNNDPTNQEIQKTDRKRKKKLKNKVSIQNRDLHVKIKWKDDKKGKNKIKVKQLSNTPKTMYQSVLNFSPEFANEVIVKPEPSLTPMKRKYCKHEKGTDTLKQKTLLSFFQVRPDTKQD